MKATSRQISISIRNQVFLSLSFFWCIAYVFLFHSTSRGPSKAVLLLNFHNLFPKSHSLGTMCGVFWRAEKRKKEPWGGGGGSSRCVVLFYTTVCTLQGGKKKECYSVGKQGSLENGASLFTERHASFGYPTHYPVTERLQTLANNNVRQIHSCEERAFLQLS